MKKIDIKKIEVNEEVEVVPLRIVSGKYGQQLVGEIGGQEYFLPRHTQLIKKILLIGLTKPVSVKRLTAGDKKHQAEYNIELLDKELDKGQQRLL